MRRYFTIFILLFFIFLAGANAAETAVSEAPDFKLADMEGRPVSLHEYNEKNPVLLLFWTTWCPFCRKELGVLNKTYPQLVQEGVKLFTIDVGESPERVRSFAKSRDLKLSVLLDQDGVAADAYKVLGVPTYILINKQGKIVFRDNSFPQEYKKLIAK